MQKYKNTRDHYIKTIIYNLLGISNNSLSEKDYIMLGGLTGVGKTTLIEYISQLLNIELFSIEASHLSEEHIINIPFIKRKDEEYSIENSKPFLLSELEKIQKPLYSPEKHLEIINNNFELKKHFELYKKEIETIQNKYSRIFFIDEFYRMNNVRISNLLRTILNGFIGSNKIPDNTYLIFASNFDSSDEGLSDIPQNHQFTFLNIIKSSNTEYKNYILNKHKLETNTIFIFEELLKINFLGFKDEHIHISPRRFEEILLYINYNIENIEVIYSYLYLQLKNYRTGKLSELWNEIYIILNNYISNNTFKPLSWQDLFKNQIETNNHLKNIRKYTLSLTGSHGISKTTFIREICKEMNLNLIEIDSSTLNPDDVIGLPLSYYNNEVLHTKFSEPPLYNTIMKQYISSNNNNKYNTILFLDEITRSEPEVFNAIRKMLLTKSINETYSLPEDILIVSALNPNGLGTIELTPHLIDVIDFIPVELDKKDLTTYLNKLSLNTELENKYAINFSNISFLFLDEIFKKFPTEDEQLIDTCYTLLIDNEELYLSPREIDSITSNFLLRISYYLQNIEYKKNHNYSEEFYIDFNLNIKYCFTESFYLVFDFILLKYQFENTKTLKEFLSELFDKKYLNILKHIRYIQSENIISFFDLIKKHDFNLNILKNDDSLLIVNQYINTLEHDSIIIQELTNVLNELFITDKTNYEINVLEQYNLLYNFFKKLNYSKFDNQINDRISKTFSLTWKELSNNLVYEPKNHKIVLKILDDSILETTYKEWFTNNKGELTDTPFFLLSNDKLNV